MSGGQALAGVKAENDVATEVATVDEYVEAHTAETDIEPEAPVRRRMPVNEPVWIEDEEPEPEPRAARAPWILGAAVSVGWLLGMGLWFGTHADWGQPATVAVAVAALGVVPILVLTLLVATAIGSGAHARRMMAGARAMRAEALALETTIARLDATIEARRASLAEQVQLLGTLGDSATARLAEIGSALSQEVTDVEANARALGDSAEAAEAKLAVLLATMPRAQAEADTLGGKVERIGLSASERIADLDARLVALTERGHAAEVLAGGAAEKLAAHIVRMDATSETAAARLDTVTAAMAAEIDALLGRTADAVDESRKGIVAQGDAMLAMVQTHQAALQTAARESAEALAERIEIVELVIDRVTRRLEEQRQSGDAMVGNMESWIGRVEERFAVLQREGIARTDRLAESMAALGGNAETMAEALQRGGGIAAQTIASAETLLIALDSAAREMDETLPEALARLDRRLDATHQRVAATKPEMLALVNASESTSDAIDSVATALAAQRRTADEVAGKLDAALIASREKATSLDKAVEESIDRVDSFVESAAPRLLEALLRVKDTALSAAEKARDTLAEVIPEAAQALEHASEDAFRRAAGAGVQEQIASVAEVAEAAVAAATRAAERLDSQLHRISKATAAVDGMIEDARAEEHDNFARRASQLIETMNSAAIDISRSIAPEVTDTAWQAYLKGDRGVFTRRAVRLLDTNDQREVARLYENEAEFREHVNRYIHDFEGMLRTILAQREGSTLSVALLSSDMGKLYVALAQAIERLR